MNQQLNNFNEEQEQLDLTQDMTPEDWAIWLEESV